MSQALAGKDFKAQLKALCPLVDTIRLILTAARHAFNQHSRAQLEEMSRLKRCFTLDIDPFFLRVEAELKKGSHPAREQILKFEKILTHLELMADKAASLADHLRYKANRGAILEERDVFAVNSLFTRLNGLLQALVDIFQRNDPALKAYMLQECEAITSGWFSSQSDHEVGMMDTPGRPAAWSVYLHILDAGREIVKHIQAILAEL